MRATLPAGYVAVPGQPTVLISATSMSGTSQNVGWSTSVTNVVDIGSGVPGGKGYIRIQAQTAGQRRGTIHYTITGIKDFAVYIECYMKASDTSADVRWTCGSGATVQRGIANHIPSNIAKTPDLYYFGTDFLDGSDAWPFSLWQETPAASFPTYWELRTLTAYFVRRP